MSEANTVTVRCRKCGGRVATLEYFVLACYDRRGQRADRGGQYGTRHVDARHPGARSGPGTWCRKCNAEYPIGEVIDVAVLAQQRRKKTVRMSENAVRSSGTVYPITAGNRRPRRSTVWGPDRGRPSGSVR